MRHMQMHGIEMPAPPPHNAQTTRAYNAGLDNKPLPSDLNGNTDAMAAHRRGINAHEARKARMRIPRH